MEEEEHIVITLIEKDGELEVLESEIIDSINGYLIRNKGGVSDFNLIKDITQRSIDTVESEIDSMIPIPLYLGLAGTMLGIVVGLFALPDIQSSNFESSIDVLIGGVKIAMIASFSGLILTVLNSGYLFKNAKTETERKINQFYTFLQTELLPAISQNLTASIYSLQSNLVEFNDTFKSNILKFDSSLDDISHAFNSQIELIKELKNLDMVQLSKLNVTVLAELRTSTREFEKFNQYLQLLNSFVENAERLNYNLSQQLTRTVSIEGVALEIGKNIQLNKSLMDWLKDDRDEMSARKQIISNAVIDVDSHIQRAFDLLKISIEERIRSIQEITIKEEQLLETLLKDNRGNLDELKKLTTMNEGLVNMGQEIKKQNLILKDQSSNLKDLVQLFKTKNNNSGNREVPGEPMSNQPISNEISKTTKFLAVAFFVCGLIVFSIQIIQFIVSLF
jgi:hypothetical protein